MSETANLRDVRRAYELTRTRVAEALSMTQDGVSRMDKRSDFLLSTLRSSIEAMGRKLRLVAEFPDRKTVVISDLDSMGTDEKPPRRGKKLASAHLHA